MLQVWSGDLNAGDFVADFSVAPDNEHVLAGTETGAVVYRYCMHTQCVVP